MPAIPGTMTSSEAWSPLEIDPNSARKISGNRKLKNAALGLRQNIRRSRRYCRHASPRSDIGRQLQVDLLQRRPRDLDLVELLAARERLAGELVKDARRIVGDDLGQLSGGVEIRAPPPPRRVDPELARRADREDAPALDDRHAI